MEREQILDDVWPSEGEQSAAQETFQDIKEYINEEHGREARLMGSLAKRTFLSGDKDLDIFVFFDTDTSKEELEEQGLKIGKDVFRHFNGEHTIAFAEHPYTKGTINGFDVEIVPAYSVESADEMRSAVDRTPLHTEWVNDHLSRNEKQEVVLLKAFLKAQEIYGSTLRVRGFSGYLCELLIGHYSSFGELIDNAVEWNQQEVIDPEGHHETLPQQLQDKFSEDSLIVIDPADPERNVAAVLDHDNYARFIYSAWQLRNDPGEHHFHPSSTEPDREAIRDELEARGRTFIIRCDRPDILDDILYPQLRRLMKRVRSLLREHEFQLFESGFHATDSTIRIILDFKVADLPARVKHHGPQVFHNTEHIENFTTKYDNTWIEDGQLVTIIEREHTEPRSLLSDFLQGDLQEKGVPDNLVGPLEDAEIREPRLEDEDWLRFLTDFLHLRPGASL